MTTINGENYPEPGSMVWIRRKHDMSQVDEVETTGLIVRTDGVFCCIKNTNGTKETFSAERVFLTEAAAHRDVLADLEKKVETRRALAEVAAEKESNRVDG